MIELNLKRNNSNELLTFGTLFCPKLGIQCATMEIKVPRKNEVLKHCCCIDDGSYQMKMGMVEGHPFMPVLRHKPKGFAVRPRLTLKDLDYVHLLTGNIALGTEIASATSLKTTEQFKEFFIRQFTDLFTWRPKEIVVLNVYYSATYIHEPINPLRRMELADEE